MISLTGVNFIEDLITLISTIIVPMSDWIPKHKHRILD